MTLLEAGNRLADAVRTQQEYLSCTQLRRQALKQANAEVRATEAAWREAVARQEDDGK